jgi:hypothetical protein
MNVFSSNEKVGHYLNYLMHFCKTGLLLASSCLLIVTVTAVDLQLAAVYQQQQLTPADPAVEQSLIRAVKAVSGKLRLVSFSPNYAYSSQLNISSNS